MVLCMRLIKSSTDKTKRFWWCRHEDLSLDSSNTLNLQIGIYSEIWIFIAKLKKNSNQT